MGAKNANISRNMYDEKKRFQQLVFQQGKPPTDADFNDGEQIIYNLLRRFIQKIVGNGSPNNGFKIVGTGANNDFTITGGDGTVEGAGRLLVGGFQCFLPSDRSYKGNDNLECAPVSTGLTETVLTDSAANFTLGGSSNNLADRTLMPDITQPGLVYTISSNTQTTITVSGSMVTDGIDTGTHYRVELSTPSGNRTDEVYIDCYLDEIDGEEDPEIKHTLGMEIETHRRLKLIQNVFVAEGSTTPANYTDSDGNKHYTLKLATIQRYSGQAAINPGDVTDNRPLLDGGIWDLWQEIINARGSMPKLGNRLDITLNENGTLKGGQMTGNLNPDAGVLIDGYDVSELGNEVINARGSRPSLDSRLDIFLNNDGSPKDGAGSGLDADLLDGVQLSSIQSEIDSDIAAHASNSSAHHSRYTDAEARAAADDLTSWGHSNKVTGLNADYLDGKHASEISSEIGGVIPSGSKMIFFQVSAPVGWTQDTSHNDKMLRVVSGPGSGSGGSWVISGLTYAVPNHKHATPFSKRLGIPNFLIPRDGSPWGQIYGSDLGVSLATDRISVSADPGTNVPFDKTSEPIDNIIANISSDASWRPSYIDTILCTKN